MFDLTGMTALVTGASGGIGSAIAKSLAEQGATLALSGSNGDKLAAFAKELGGDHKTLVTNLSDGAAVDALVPAAVEALGGKIDILVNNAGVVYPGNDTGDWDKVIAVNLRGVFLTGREVMKGMIARNYGKIINIASVAALAGCMGMPSYNASKGGVVSLTRSQAMDGVEHGITANCICPGVFSSEMTEGFVGGCVDDSACGSTPMKRIGREGELNGALIYFASDASSYTTGQFIAVDGGWTSYLPQ